MGKSKKKSRKKQIFLLICILFLLSVVGIGAGLYFHTANSEEEIQVKENQTLLVAQISEINGNEMTFREAEKVSLSDRKNQKEKEEANRSAVTDNADNTVNQSASTGNGESEVMPGNEMPNGENPGGNMSDREKPNENIPSGDMPDMGNGAMSAPEGLDENRSNGMQGRENRESAGTGGQSGLDQNREEQENRTIYSVSGEEQTMLIPVGTEVTTTLGTVTTFSRLAAGDIVKILMEKNENGEQVIVGIWMVE